MEKVHRVSTKDLQIATKQEMKEHPWASERTARHLARDHLSRNPEAYEGENVTVVLNQNVKAVAQKKRKKPVQQQQGGGGPDWIPQNLRMWG